MEVISIDSEANVTVHDGPNLVAGEFGVHVHKPPYLLATDRSSTSTQRISFFLPFCTSGEAEVAFAESEIRKGRNHEELHRIPKEAVTYSPTLALLPKQDKQLVGSLDR